jgi:hypothetical protein
MNIKINNRGNSRRNKGRKRREEIRWKKKEERSEGDYLVLLWMGEL